MSEITLFSDLEPGRWRPSADVLRTRLKLIDFELLFAVGDRQVTMVELAVPEAWPGGWKAGQHSDRSLKNRLKKLRARGYLRKAGNQVLGPGRHTAVLEMTELGRRALQMELELARALEEGRAEEDAA